MNNKIQLTPASIAEQVSRACLIIQNHFSSTLEAIHLFGSTVDGGLKPHSDIDLLVTVSSAPDENSRRAFMLELLKISAPPGSDMTLRALEVTVVTLGEVVPWRYPARRELQFGEWLRIDLLAGIFEPAVIDHDLAIMLTKARNHSIALRGPSAGEWFDPVPPQDFISALSDTLAQWNSPEDWTGDEHHIVLALARIWYSAATGMIAPKDIAATWLLMRLPIEHQSVLRQAREIYLGNQANDLASYAVQVEEFIYYSKSAITKLFEKCPAVPGIQD